MLKSIPNLARGKLVSSMSTLLLVLSTGNTNLNTGFKWAKICSSTLVDIYVITKISGSKIQSVVLYLLLIPIQSSINLGHRLFPLCVKDGCGSSWVDPSPKINISHFAACKWMCRGYHWWLFVYGRKNLKIFPSDTHQQCHLDLWWRVPFPILPQKAQKPHGWVQRLWFSQFQG